MSDLFGLAMVVISLVAASYVAYIFVRVVLDERDDRRLARKAALQAQRGSGLR